MGHLGIASSDDSQQLCLTDGLCNVHLETGVPGRKGRWESGVGPPSGSIAGLLLHLVSWSYNFSSST